MVLILKSQFENVLLDVLLKNVNFQVFEKITFSGFQNMIHTPFIQLISNSMVDHIEIVSINSLLFAYR